MHQGPVRSSFVIFLKVLSPLLFYYFSNSSLTIKNYFEDLNCAGTTMAEQVCLHRWQTGCTMIPQPHCIHITVWFSGPTKAIEDRTAPCWVSGELCERVYEIKRRIAWLGSHLSVCSHSTDLSMPCSYKCICLPLWPACMRVCACQCACLCISVCVSVCCPCGHLVCNVWYAPVHDCACLHSCV